MGKILQITGLLALLAWTASGFVAWGLTKEQVHVTLEEGGSGASRAADDPTALLAEQVRGLEQDVRALAAALGDNMRALDESIDASHAERITALDQRVTAALAALDARVSADLTETRTLSDAVAGLRSEWATRAAELAGAAAPAEETREPADVAAVVLPDSGAAAERAPSPSTSTDTADPPHPAPVAVAEPAQTPEPARRRSFLAFRLPSDDFTFEGRRTWEVIPSLSRVGFDAESTLHDFTGTTSKVTANLVVDLARPAERPVGTIHVSAASLDTGLEDRNTAMCEHLGTADSPEITFEWTAFEPGTIATDKREVDGTAKGRMTIHGVTHEVSMPVHMGLDESRRLSIDGSMPLKMSDYEVEVPSKLGLISVTDEVEVWIALRARPLAKEAE